MRGFVVCLVLLVACEGPTVQWNEPESAPADTLGAMALTAPGRVEFARTAVPAGLPIDSARCEKSIVTARDGGRWYAAWLSRRADSSVVVLAARSADSGRTWSKPGVADSVDVAKVGCARPGPSIAAADGYVHISYSLEAPEGYGVFFAHSMDSTATFHSPVTVVYGDRLSATATSADGMQVAVAYEDPSGNGHRVDIALSRTQGHSFEARERGSRDEMSAVAPEVAVRDSTVALSFATAGSGNRMVRLGKSK
jgi:hypothetical protein